MCPSHDEFYSALFESMGLEMKKCLACGLSCFIKAWGYSILFEQLITTRGDSCSAFYKFPESKSPLK